MLLGEPAPPGSEAVLETMRANATGLPTMQFGKVWSTSLQRGVVEGVINRPLPPPGIVAASIVTAFTTAKKRPVRPLGADNLEVSFSPDPKLLDGQSGNSPWLLELPDPLSKLVWDNAAYVSPGTAQEMGVVNGDVIALGRDGATPLEIPVFVLPGVAEHCVALHLGWGRTNAGRYGGIADRAKDDRWAKPEGIYPFAQQQPNNGAPRAQRLRHPDERRPRLRRRVQGDQDRQDVQACHDPRAPHEGRAPHRHRRDARGVQEDSRLQQYVTERSTIFFYVLLFARRPITDPRVRALFTLDA